MEDPIFTYFSENLAAVSKEEILTALGNALKSANYWRDACLQGGLSVQNISEEMVAPTGGLK